MSKRPPEDESFIEKILQELDGSIDDVDAESKAAMKDALRDSMQMWFPNIGMEPEIEILDGEKDVLESSQKQVDETDIHKETLRSQLQILESPDDILNEEEPFPNVQVRVLSPQDLLGGVHTLFGGEEQKPLPERGSIDLESGEKLPIVERSEVATYRLSCEQGKMSIRTETKKYELRAGQSMDMDAATIELEALEATTGWFQSV